IRNRQPPVIRNDERRPSFSARNVQTYTITSFTDAHNSRQKIASIIKKPDGGGGDVNSPYPPPAQS
ncbi:MAG: hypothetical protein LBJ35_03775, partial [Spirochaetaceae bacterium]|nr:hypothetical protein [Spirochaetaceae bacterium]